MGDDRERTLRATYSDRVLRAIGRFCVPEIQVVVDYDGAVDAGRLDGALRDVLEGWPVLACRLVERWAAPRWERLEPAALAATRLVFEVDGGAGDADAAVEPFLAERFPTEQGPQVHALVVHRPGGDRVVVKVDHTPADTVATKQIAYAVAGRFGASRGPGGCAPTVPDADGTRSFRPFLAGRGPRALAALALHGAREHLVRRPLDPVARVPTQRARVGRPRFTLRHMEGAEADAIRAAALRHEATVNDVFVAATFRALACDVAAPFRSRLQITVDLRRHLPPGVAPAPCNMSGFAYVDLGRDPGGSFAETVAAVRRITSDLKRGPIGLPDHAFLQPLYWALPHGAFVETVVGSLRLKSAAGQAEATLTNLGLVEVDRLALGEARAVRARVICPASEPGAFAAGLSGDGAGFTLSVGHWESSVPRARVAALLDAIAAAATGRAAS